MKLNFLGLVVVLIVSFLDIYPAFGGTTPTTQPLSQSELKRYNDIVDQLSPKVEKLTRRELVDLGKAYSAIGNWTGAIKMFTAVLSNYPKDVEAKTLIAAEQIRTGKERDGLQTLKSVLEINKKYIPAYRYLIGIYERRKNHYELRMIYIDLVASFGKKIEYITKLCELTANEGLFDQAVEYCTTGTELDKKEAKNFIHLGVVLRERGETVRGERLLKSAADVFSNNLLAQLTYAEHQEQKKDYVSAYSFYKKAVNLDASSVEAVLGLANSAFEIQKYQEAMEYFLKSCRLDRKTLPAFRKATNVLRLMKTTAWLYKYEKSQEHCF